MKIVVTFVKLSCHLFRELDKYELWEQLQLLRFICATSDQCPVGEKSAGRAAGMLSFVGVFGAMVPVQASEFIQISNICTQK